MVVRQSKPHCDVTGQAFRPGKLTNKTRCRTRLSEAHRLGQRLLVGHGWVVVMVWRLALGSMSTQEDLPAASALFCGALCHHQSFHTLSSHHARQNRPVSVAAHRNHVDAAPRYLAARGVGGGGEREGEPTASTKHVPSRPYIRYRYGLVAIVLCPFFCWRWVPKARPS